MAGKKKKQVAGDTLQKRSQLGEIWHRLKKNKLAMVSLGFIVILVLAVSFADFIAPYPYDQIDLANALQKPSLKHLMGTDDFGRDLFSRILYGGRISLLVAFCTVMISIVVSAILGAAAGYFGGWFDSVVMRVVDVFMAIPGMLLAISIAAALGSGIVNTALAITISNIPGLTRVVRSSVLLVYSSCHCVWRLQRSYYSPSYYPQYVSASDCAGFSQVWGCNFVHCWYELYRSRH